MAQHKSILTMLREHLFLLHKKLETLCIEKQKCHAECRGALFIIETSSMLLDQGPNMNRKIKLLNFETPDAAYHPIRI
jgi:hypothetical protein